MGSRSMRSNQGFTIIELVVVIVIIGILAATALPRFVDLTGDAHTASVQGMGGSLRSGVNLVHAGWLAKGASAATNNVAVEGGGVIGVTDAGWPENSAAAGGDGTPTAAECVALWQGILNPAPPIAAAAGSTWLASVVNTDNCRFAYNAAPGRYIDYDIGDGSVVITVP